VRALPGGVPRDEGYPNESRAAAPSPGVACCTTREAAKCESLDALAAGATLVHSSPRPTCVPPDRLKEAPRSTTSTALRARRRHAGSGACGLRRAIEMRAWSESGTRKRSRRLGRMANAGAGRAPQAGTGRPRFNGKEQHPWRLPVQLRVASIAPGTRRARGLSALKLDLYFENGIMSIPRIFAGRNTLRFQLRDAARLRDRSKSSTVPDFLGNPDCTAPASSRGFSRQSGGMDRGRGGIAPLRLSRIAY